MIGPTGKKCRLIILMISLVVMASGLTVLAAKPDRKAPTVPANLKAKAVTDSSALLTWSKSKDNAGIVSYEVYQNKRRLARQRKPAIR